MDTSGGQSGSGVWERDGDEVKVVGIHVRGGVSENEATRITEPLYRHVRALMDAEEAGPTRLKARYDLVLGAWNATDLEPDEYVAYEFDYDPPEGPRARRKARLRIQVKKGWALVIRPDGTLDSFCRHYLDAGAGLDAR